MELNKRYIVDLSQAQTPADIVFEISNILEVPEAANQKVWLKLGDVALNQSQLLSINSLISSINSSLDLVESKNKQTELAVTTLGITIKDVEDAMQDELSNLEAQAPQDAPSEQYVAMTEHLDDENEEISNSESLDTNCEILKQVQNDSNTQDTVLATDNEEIDIAEKNLEAVFDDSADTQDDENNNIQDDKQVDDTETVTEYNTYVAEPLSEEKEEEIQNQLDSIFDSEAKLENILSGEKDLAEMQNWPLTKEVDYDDFEIPEDEMTDEDYAILKMDTQYHKQTVRSGQVIKSNGNVVIIGDCHPGCEIHAAGDITVWGILGGIAHAGCNGNTKARIRALTLNAIQLRIADSFARRPDHIKNIYVEKSNTFTPEEARNINGSIVILKVND